MKTLSRIACRIAAVAYALVAVWMPYAAASNAWLWFDDSEFALVLSGALSFLCAVSCALTAAWLRVGADA